MDAGCGVGIVGLILAKIRGAARVVGVEIQDELAGYASRNAAENGVGDRMEVVNADLRDLPPALNGAFDVVCANPPYRELGAGRVCPGGSRARARHELTLTLTDLTSAAASALRERGRFFFIHQIRRAADVRAALSSAGFNMYASRFIRARDGAAAGLFLGAAGKGYRGGERETPPLTVYRAPGVFTEEVAAAYEGVFRDAGPDL